MTAIELERKKAKLFEEIDSEEVFDKVSQLVKKLKKQNAVVLPNQYKSIEELYADIDQAETDIKEGRTYTQEEVKNMAKSWI